MHSPPWHYLRQLNIRAFFIHWQGSLVEIKSPPTVGAGGEDESAKGDIIRGWDVESSLWNPQRWALLPPTRERGIAYKNDSAFREVLNCRICSCWDTNDGEYVAAECAGALGMESGDIKDHQINASSSYNEGSVGVQNAR
ncbi:hypothetical protein CEXT_479301 [Caerostris extrusa]|uniref:F5/8 type C domain-containing protein n=1 Tax=Caerostris extrusa TaxID=172846 RepID=A0AAV4U0K1_CAEEX|nr:hypothetical protein CEXT_479301 [Caerostris extrusa]